MVVVVRGALPGFRLLVMGLVVWVLGGRGGRGGGGEGGGGMRRGGMRRGGRREELEEYG